MTERTPVTDTPSRFWTKLGAEHERLLAEHGVERVKRTQALRYFTWRWRPSQLKDTEQLRFLLRHTTPEAVWSAMTTAMPLDDELWDGTGFSRAERRATVVATRLLWDYAERNGAREVLDLPSRRSARRCRSATAAG